MQTLSDRLLKLAGERQFFPVEAVKLLKLPKKSYPEVRQTLRDLHKSGRLAKAASRRYFLPLTGQVELPLAPKEEKRVNQRISHLQAHQIIEVLKQVYDQEAGGYLPDASDETVAKGMNFPCVPGSVAYLRLELFGPFKKRANGHAPSGELEERVAKLERTLANLATALGYKEAQ